MAMGQMSKQINLNIGVTEILWPYEVVNVLQETMEQGLKKHPENDGWDETAEFHISRAIMHIADETQEGLEHAFTRLMMAVAIRKGLNNEK